MPADRDAALVSLTTEPATQPAIDADAATEVAGTDAPQALASRAASLVSLPVDGGQAPADHGLGSLGLLMQIGGSLGMAAAAAVAMPAALSGSRQSSVIFFFAVLYGVRAAFHRLAGSAVLYGTGEQPRRSVLTYVCVAACHSLVTLLLLRRYVDDALLLRLAAVLLAWPAVLSTCSALPRPGRLLARAIPSAEDRGFEGAAVLMTVFGSAGVLCSVLLLGMLERPALLALVVPAGSADVVRLLAIAMCGLCATSCVMHLRAGMQGASGAWFHAHEAHAVQHGAGGLTADVVALLLAGALAIATGNLGIVLIAGVCARSVLRAWPAILRRLVAERSFDAYLAGERAPAFRRAPDAGLTALGWVLLALGVPAVGQSLVEGVLAGLGWHAAWPVDPGLVSLGHGWRTLLVGGLALWAGLALVRMRAGARRVAALYGVVGMAAALGNAMVTLVEAYTFVPVDGEGATLLLLVRLAGAGIELAVPMATLWLVERATVPRAVVLQGRGR